MFDDFSPVAGPEAAGTSAHITATGVLATLRTITTMVLVCEVIGFLLVLLVVLQGPGALAALATLVVGTITVAVTYAFMTWATEVLNMLVRIADNTTPR
jgi:hypothetical protein